MSAVFESKAPHLKSMPVGDVFFSEVDVEFMSFPPFLHVPDKQGLLDFLVGDDLLEVAVQAVLGFLFPVHTIEVVEIPAVHAGK